MPNHNENRKKWNHYIEQKYGKNVNFTTIFYKNKDNIIFRYRPLFFNNYTTKILKFSCLEEGCEGKGIFDLKSEQFEETNKHSLKNNPHELSCHPKNYEICDYFVKHPESNTIQILREYQNNE